MKKDYELQEKIEKIFMPYSVGRREPLLHGGRLAHYTTAENAIRIIQSREIWMRNARGMNDFSEIEYGFHQLRDYFRNEVNLKKFNAALDLCAVDAGKDAIAMFDQWWAHIQTSTYICCLSEHGDSEDSHGRLSMWRAFGRGTAGVAIVFNAPQPYSALPLRVFLSPIAYFSQNRLERELDTVIKNIENNYKMLKALPRDNIVGWAYMMLAMAVISLKHPGFHEEQEWRLIHLPGQFPSQHISAVTEIIGGIPQVIHKIHLKNKPDAEISNIELPQLLDRVIIGPSQHAFSIYESLSKELAEAGVEDAANKVVISGIPLRN